MVRKALAAEHPSGKHSRRRDQSAGPRAEHDDRRDLHGSGEPEAFPLHGLARALAIRVLEQLHEDDGREKEGEGRVRATPEILASEIPSTPKPRAIVTRVARDGRIRPLSARSRPPLRLGRWHG